MINLSTMQIPHKHSYPGQVLFCNVDKKFARLGTVAFQRFAFIGQAPYLDSRASHPDAHPGG
ncbi:hypothetical protein H6F43_04020 [Leptolyngbya sp. FACHB-36]|nr:hypothetical protein [Leptolyngbya sp. FACHB-36]